MTYVKIRTDSFAAFFSLVEEYAKDKWQLKKYYIENFTKQGVILKNYEDNTVEIWTEAVFEGEEKNATKIVSNNIKKIAQLFSSKNNKEKQEKRKDKEKIEEAETLPIFAFQGLNNFEELKKEVRKFYQKYQAEIKQNPDFTNWIEIRSEKKFSKDEDFYVYLGKKRKNINVNEKNLFVSTFMEKIWGEIALRRNIKFIYQMEKENNENLPKELERFWSVLVNDNEKRIKPTFQERERERETTKLTLNNKTFENNLTFI